MNRRIHKLASARSEGGAALITGLIMIVLLGLLGLLSMKQAMLQQLMSGARADRQTAVQAAETALRDAESYAQTSLGPASTFDAKCTGGRCLPGTSAPAWRTVDWDHSAIPYGEKTGAAPLPGLSRPPRYIIELLPQMATRNGNSLSTAARTASDSGTPFRITAVGYGRLDGTRVMLQSVFVKQ